MSLGIRFRGWGQKIGKIRVKSQFFNKITEKDRTGKFNLKVKKFGTIFMEKWQCSNAERLLPAYGSSQ